MSKNCQTCVKNSEEDSSINCLKCENNFYKREDSNYCYTEDIDNYYLD